MNEEAEAEERRGGEVEKQSAAAMIAAPCAAFIQALGYHIQLTMA
jgi:hypothetical protein